LSDIQLQILSGPNKGKALRLQQPSITFGRAADNTLVVDQDYVSRYHGELQLQDDGQWLLINHSPNGTYLGTKLVRKKPRAVRDQDTITIGEQPLFQLGLLGQGANAAPVEEDEPEPSDDSTEEDTDAASPRRRKLWMGVGVYLAAMLALFVFLAVQFGGGDTAQSEDGFNFLKPSEIGQEIRTLGPDPSDIAPSQRSVNQHLREARMEKNLIDSHTDALYKAHWHYQHARAYSPQGRLPDGADRVQALEIEKRLIDQAQEQYDQAMTLYKDGRYRRAAQASQRLLELYPATNRQQNSRIYQNADELRFRAKQKAGS
jgi:pSer/pThr/pTyr-binding forkhead associated (FHA) protein